MGRTILIVEDEARIRSMYRRALGMAGYTVLEASTAGEGFAVLERTWVDLVILDIRMPEVDGTALNDVIRSLFGNRKVIVASVYPVEEQRCMAPGAADYFDKADGINVLIDKVMSHLVAR